MKILNILAILGVMAVVVAAGVAIHSNGGLTGFTIFGGDNQDSSSDFSKEQLQAALGTITGNSEPEVNNTLNESVNDSLSNETVVEESTSSGGGGGSSTPSCTENIITTSLTNWTNISCLSTDLMNQTRNITKSDSNNCGFVTINITEYQQIETCDYCTPNWVEVNTSCQSDDTITEYYIDNNNCYALTGLASDNNPPANDSYECSFNFCSTDSECDDGNELTIDSCRDTIIGYDLATDTITYGKTCVNIIPNIYGMAYNADENSTALGGINVSVYNSNVYDVYNETYGDYEALVAKSMPDAVSDANGAFGLFVDPDEMFHLVFQGSNEKAFNVKSRTNTSQKIITETDGYIKVYFEKASAGLLSDLYIDEPVNELLVQNSNVGEVVYVNNQTEYSSGTELKFYIRVHGTSWGIGEYNHYSDTKYAQVERLDKDTWRIHFEDLPDSWPPDWDFNDAVVLVDIVGAATNETAYDNDCDNDSIVNWLDNDDACDVGEEDQEINENNPEVENFNAEGHILYSGEYGENNKYTCGDVLKFMMFGVNHMSTDQTITFMVEDHTEKGGNIGDIIYMGNISNPEENLIVHAGLKEHKIFEFEIPCNLSTDGNGKHDIHIVWEDDERFHKIGNFFVIPDTTNPTILAEGEVHYPMNLLR